MTQTDKLACLQDDLTPEWASAILSAALNDKTDVIDLNIETIGTGQMSKTLRVTLLYNSKPANAPESLIVKIASPDATTRTTGSDLGLYETEINFYRDLAPRLAVSVPCCYAAVFDPESCFFTLALEDLSHVTEVGNVLVGGTVEQAQVSLKELAKMQASCWNDTSLKSLPLFADDSKITALFASYTDKAPAFIADLGDEMGAEKCALIEKAMPFAPRWLAETPAPLVVQHADYRLDNLLYKVNVESDVPLVTVVDWQTLRLGNPLVDVAYYLSGCLSVEDRRAHEQQLLREYHSTLIDQGVTDYSWDQLWQDYRRGSLYGLFMGVSSYSLVGKSERGKQIFLRSVSKRASHVLDVGGAEFIA